MKWIIEARDEQGQLVFSCPQPEEWFTSLAIMGINEDQMARMIFRKLPDANLVGDNIPNWPRLLNPLWVARKKTW